MIQRVKDICVKKFSGDDKYYVMYECGSVSYIYYNRGIQRYRETNCVAIRGRPFPSVMTDISNDERVKLIGGDLLLRLDDGGLVNDINDPYVRECVVEFLSSDGDDYFEEYEEFE